MLIEPNTVCVKYDTHVWKYGVLVYKTNRHAINPTYSLSSYIIFAETGIPMGYPFLFM